MIAECSRRLCEEGRQTLVLVGDSPMVNLVNSNLREKRVLCNIGMCVRHISESLRLLSPLCRVIGQSRKRASDDGHRDLARDGLLLLSVPDAMTEDEMDDFGMRHGCMHQ